MSNILRLELKDPDGVANSIQDYVTATLELEKLPQDERDLLHDHRYEKVQAAITNWVDCSEYVTIDIDLETGKATVVPQ